MIALTTKQGGAATNIRYITQVPYELLLTACAPHNLQTSVGLGVPLAELSSSLHTLEQPGHSFH